MPSPEPEPREHPRAFNPAQSAGLFVGVSKFEDLRIPAVPYAVDDAVDLAFFFVVEQGLVPVESCVLALSGEPVKPESAERLAELLSRGVQREGARQSDIYRWLASFGRRGGPEGLFLVAIASHGTSEYLFSQDKVLEPGLSSGVRVNELFSKVAQARAHRRLVLLDTCSDRDQGRGGRDEVRAEDFAQAIANAKGQVVLWGTPEGGKAYDDPEERNGVFSRAVLDGLRGQAPADAEGWITVGNLAMFLQERVREWVEANRPSNAPFHGIEQKISGPGSQIRLVRHPEATAARERYRGRRRGAEERLKANLGGVLTGGLYDRVMALLPEGVPGGRSEELLGEIEKLDGGQSAKRALKGLVEEIEQEAKAGAEPRAAAPPAPSPPAPVAEKWVPIPVPPPVKVPVPRDPPPPTAWKGRKAEGSRVGGWRTWGRWALLGLGGVGTALAVSIGVGELVNLLRAKTPEVPPAVESARTTAAESPGPAAGTQAVGISGMNFRFVPKGTYRVGSPDAGAAWQQKDERRHQVELTRGFWLAETEVTQGQWQELVPRNPSFFMACGGDCPVENVSWWEAVAFANLMSARDGLEKCYDVSSCTGELGTNDYKCGEVPFRGHACTGYRLPTEAEWEVAARAVVAGRDVADPIYSGPLRILGVHHGPELHLIAWYGGNSGIEYSAGVGCSGWKEKQFPASRCGTHPVQGKNPNAWGFPDMLGNVSEWTADAYAEYPAKGLVKDPLVESGTLRVFRGGSWRSDARTVRAASRLWSHPSDRWDDLGFRLARGQAAPG